VGKLKNILGVVIDGMKPHIVETTLFPGDKVCSSLALIEVNMEVRMIDILQETYGEEFGPEQRIIAEKIYGLGKINMDFGVFFLDRKMVFAFSRRLANYNKVTKEVDYKSLDRMLMADMKLSVGAVPVRPSKEEINRSNRPDLSTVIMKYALIENHNL
jgi:hypothetical protein